MEFLYRGFNCHMTVTDAMVPKSLSDDPEQGAEFGDDRVQCGDSDFTFGLSITNTIHSHEYGGNGEPTGGISTTPHFEVAKHYALGGGRFANGQVIRMSIPELKKAGVTIYRVNDCLDTPSIPSDDEHWIYFKGPFPQNTIVEAIHVYSDTPSEHELKD
ncbi:TPA: hypothetical protein F3L13_07935 [Aeromonas hydrophila]|nr:hypothetical protein [Aeromonas hydrophila]